MALLQLHGIGGRSDATQRINRYHFITCALPLLSRPQVERAWDLARTMATTCGVCCACAVRPHIRERAVLLTLN